MFFVILSFSPVTLSLNTLSIMSFCLLFLCYPVFYYLYPFCPSVFRSLVFVLLCFFCLYLSFCLKMIIFAVSIYNTVLYEMRRELYPIITAVDGNRIRLSKSMTKHIEILSYIAHNYYRDFGYNGTI